MSVFEMNRNILAALQTVVDLPTDITRLTVSIGVNMVPELTISRILRTKNANQINEVFTVTKRYRLLEMRPLEEVDVTTIGSEVKQYEIGRRA